MGLKIADLLKWRTDVILLDKQGMPILDDKKQPVRVYLRVIGDNDLEDAHRAARLASAKIRKELNDETSPLFRDRIAPIKDASREDCETILVQYRSSNLESEARANVEKEELVRLEEVAIDPDAATLEEQENLDAALEEQEARYQAQLKDYVDTRVDVIKAEVASMSDEEVRTTAMKELIGIIALSEFFTELQEQKLLRGAYTDKTYKNKAFDSIEELKDAESSIRQQLFDAYVILEYDPESIKK